jgi:hypothetical protein
MTNTLSFCCARTISSLLGHISVAATEVFFLNYLALLFVCLCIWVGKHFFMAASLHSRCTIVELLGQLGLPSSVVSSIAPFLHLTSSTESSHRPRPSWLPEESTKPRCSCSRQTPRDLNSGSGVWEASIFSIVKHLHSVMVVMHRVANDEHPSLAAPRPSIPYTLTMSDYRHLCKVAMPKLLNYCLKSILTTYLDQTFTMNHIRSTVDCLCNEDYVLQPITEEDDATDSSLSQQERQQERRDPRRMRPYSHQALLLLRLLHAVSSVSCRHPAEQSPSICFPPSHEATTTTTAPEWLTCTWADLPRHLLVLEAPQGGPRDDAFSLRPPPSAPPRQLSTSVGNPVKSRIANSAMKKRRISLDNVDGGKSSSEGESKAAKRPRRGRGIAHIPPEVQLLVLSFLPSRHIVTAEATCYTWKYLIGSTCSTRQAIHRSRSVRSVFQSFLIDDWGEKYLPLTSWSNVADFKAAQTAAATLPMMTGEEQQQTRSSTDALDMATFQLMDKYIRSTIDLVGPCVRLWVERSRVVLRTCKSHPESEYAAFARMLKADPSCSWVVSAIHQFSLKATSIFKTEVRNCHQRVDAMTSLNEIVLERIQQHYYTSIVALRIAVNE